VIDVAANAATEKVSATFEVIKTIVEGDMIVVVGIERSVVSFEGEAEPHPWVLRSTQVFRKDTNSWVRLHRHADPLISCRSVSDTIALLGNN
jgi:ketosteroid isomerase-like protein